MNAPIKALREAQVLTALDEHFAAAMMRLGNDHREEVALALALASRAVSQGDVCLDLARLCSEVAFNPTDEAATRLTLPPLARWIDVLRSSRLVSDGSDRTPLVLDNASRLYLHRYFEHEFLLAASLVARARIASTANVPAQVLGRWVHDDTSSHPAQREAVRTALERRFTVITGGPGTGKTTTVVKVMAAVIESRRHQGLPPPRILLAAPTGKAAARLSESIAQQKPRLNCDSATLDHITTQASTIHRLLGRRSETGTRFQHDADNPLACDLVVIDESSMVALPLMRRLLDAIPLHAQVVLLGDADQLASVEAGAVLANLCDAADDPGSPLHGAVARLTHSHRYPEQSGIGRLANAVRTGDATEALRLLSSDNYSDIRLHAPGAKHALNAQLRKRIHAAWSPLTEARTAAEALAALGRFRVLCAHRDGPGSVTELNTLLRRELGNAVDDYGHFAREPLLITRNDPGQQLHNGDVGVVFAREDGTLTAAFEDATHGVRDLSLARLPPHETVYAMTVHKSQGSELDHVCIVLPPKASPVLTRELLYTAITRAKKQVDIMATNDVLRAAIATRVTRTSGLTDRLRKH